MSDKIKIERKAVKEVAVNKQERVKKWPEPTKTQGGSNAGDQSQQQKKSEE